MWLYICTCLVLFYVNSAQVDTFNAQNETPVGTQKKPDTIFADVIKNISRVNNVLQELINNYEQLQKIYKSQENDESGYSDSEIDEIFKAKKSKHAKKRSKNFVTTKQPISVKFAATQMFWSDHEEDDENSPEDNDSKPVEETTADKETQNEVDIVKPKPQALSGISASRKTTTLKPVSSSSESSESSFSSSSQEKNENTKKQIVNKPDKINILGFAKPKQQNAEVIFVDTHKKPNELVDVMKQNEVKAKQKVEPNTQFVPVQLKHKTRYSKVSHGKSSPDIQYQNVQADGLNNTRKVKQIINAEKFSRTNIWDDIINNTPIHLEAHNEISMEKISRKKGRAHDMRSKNGKTALVILTKSKKNQNKATPSDEDDVSDQITIKEELKSSVLRQAYGDSCLKLVLRKCQKACMKVSKSVCNRVKCKKEEKNLFKSYSKSACIAEFHGNGVDSIPSQQIIPNGFRTKDSNDFVDLTRSGFLSAACLPILPKSENSAQRNGTQRASEPQQTLNVLRDRYERECKKISSDKCRNACTYSYTKTCETYACTKHTKKVYKSTCKLHCANAYSLYDKSSSSESDSESDSDSESESESE